MAEPGADGIDVHAGENQVAGRRVPDHMRGYRSARQFRHPGRATLDQPIDPEAGKRLSEPADEDGVIGRATVDLVSQNPFGFRPQRTLAYLAALPVQGREIMTAIPDARSADRALSFASPRRHALRCCRGRAEARIRFGPAASSGPARSSMASISAFVSHPTGWRHGFLRCDGPDVAAPFDMSRIPAADEAGEGADGRKPLIAGLGGTFALLLEMREELQHMPGREIAARPADPRACAACG